eukprot:381207_1
MEFITKNRIYVIASMGTKSRNLWYKSLKQILFNDEFPTLLPSNSQMRHRPHISNSVSVNSVSLPSFPSNNNNEIKTNTMQKQRSKGSNHDKKLSFIKILEPISEKHTKNDFNTNPVTPIGLLINSDNNKHIDAHEWNDCVALVSTSSNEMKINTMNRLKIVLSSDEEPEISNVSSADTERLMENNMTTLSSMRKTFSKSRSRSVNSDESIDDLYGSVADDRDTPIGAISYMSQNSLLLMDMNDEINKLGCIIDDKLDLVNISDMELSVKLPNNYKQMSYDATNECDEIIQSPFDLYQTI